MYVNRAPIDAFEYRGRAETISSEAVCSVSASPERGLLSVKARHVDERKIAQVKNRQLT